LWKNVDHKQRKENSIIFGIYLGEMQEKIEDTWRISLEVVKDTKGIAKFKESRKNI
jgi:hypothetical protein